MSICENCGCKVYNGACVNCDEILYIAEQHYELGTWSDTSEEFKQQVLQKEAEVIKKAQTSD